MRLSRRGLFGLLAGSAVAVPIVASAASAGDAHLRVTKEAIRKQWLIAMEPMAEWRDCNVIRWTYPADVWRIQTVCAKTPERCDDWQVWDFASSPVPVIAQKM